MNKYQVRQLPLTVAVGAVLASGSLQAATITVDSANDGPVGTYPAECTLRSAVTAANTNLAVDGCAAGDAGADEIVFSLSDPAIVLDSVISISESLTITGPVVGDASGVVVSTSSNAGLLSAIAPNRGFGNTIVVSMSDITLTGTDTTSALEAALVARNVDLNLQGVHLTDNQSPSQGSALAAFDSIVSLQDVLVADNRAANPVDQRTEALFLSSSTLTIEDSVIRNNDGALQLSLTPAQITATLIDGNDGYALVTGAGIDARESDVTLTGSTLRGNRAAYYGGAIYFSLGSLTISDSVFAYNEATGSNAWGGAIAIRSGDVSISNSEFYENTVTGDLARGGGIFSSAADLTIENSVIERNSAAGTDYAEGGGVFAYSANIVDTSISYNSILGDVALGGGLRARSSFEIRHSEVTGNRADGGGLGSFRVAGAGIYATSLSSLADDLTFINTTFYANQITAALDPNPNPQPAGVAIVGDSDDSVNMVHTSFVGNFNRAVNGFISAGVDGPEWTLANSLLSTISSYVGDDVMCANTPDIQINSLATDTSCTGVATDFSDLQLGAITDDNGGPTRTLSLGAGSVAIDAAGDCRTTLGIETDQRGVARGRLCDVGAFEVFEAVIFSDRFEGPNP